MYCIACTHGEMSCRDVLVECTAGKWVPILVMRPDDGPPVVPCFQSIDVARNFARRNLPKNWLCGVVNLRLGDAEWIEGKGWEVVVYGFPRKLKDVVPFDIEVLEYDEEPAVIAL